MASLYRPLLLPLSLAFASCFALAAWAQEEAADGPWVSSAVWDGDEIVGTKSQGLLLRPAEVFRADVDSPEELAKVAEAPYSLWATQVIGDTVVVSDYKGGIHLVQGEKTEACELEARWVRALTAAPDGEHCLAGTEDGKLIVLSVDSKKATKSVEAHKAAIFDIEFNPAGDLVATAGGDGVIHVFTWPALESAGQMTRGKEALWTLDFTEDGKHLVSGGADRRLQLWDVASQSSLLTLTRTHDWVTDLTVLPNSSLVVASCMDGNLIIADVASLGKVTEVPVTDSPIWSMDLHEDGKRIVLGTRKRGLVLTEVSDDWQSLASDLAEQAALKAPPAPE